MRGPRTSARGAGVALGLAALAGCARVGLPLPVVSPVAGSVEEGVASWYGEPFHGRLTASGEIYDMEQMTAAHRTLPFGTVVRVQNLRSGESVTLRINDRGPFARGRILDVSRRAARDLAMLGPGTAPVRITIVTAAPEMDCWEVQAGAFEVRENAEGLRARLEQDGQAARIVSSVDGFHRVRLGPFPSRTDAGGIASRLDGFVLGCSLTE